MCECWLPSVFENWNKQAHKQGYLGDLISQNDRTHLNHTGRANIQHTYNTKQTCQSEANELERFKMENAINCVILFNYILLYESIGSHSMAIFGKYFLSTWSF